LIPHSRSLNTALNCATAVPPSLQFRENQVVRMNSSIYRALAYEIRRVARFSAASPNKSKNLPLCTPNLSDFTAWIL
jgi:hypothetical protein